MYTSLVPLTAWTSMPKAESYVKINGLIDNNSKSKLSNTFQTKLLKFTCLNKIKHKLNLLRKPT